MRKNAVKNGIALFVSSAGLAAMGFGGWGILSVLSLGYTIYGLSSSHHTSEKEEKRGEKRIRKIAEGEEKDFNKLEQGEREEFERDKKNFEHFKEWDNEQKEEKTKEEQVIKYAEYSKKHPNYKVLETMTVEIPLMINEYNKLYDQYIELEKSLNEDFRSDDNEIKGIHKDAARLFHEMERDKAFESGKEQDDMHEELGEDKKIYDNQRTIKHKHKEIKSRFKENLAILLHSKKNAQQCKHHITQLYKIYRTQNYNRWKKELEAIITLIKHNHSMINKFIANDADMGNYYRTIGERINENVRLLEKAEKTDKDIEKDATKDLNAERHEQKWAA